MSMKRVLVLSALATVAFTGSAIADTQAKAVQKMIAARAPAAIPTGIDVPGCAYYELTPSGKVRQYCDLTDFNRPGNIQQFWEERARRGHGSDSGNGGGGDSGQ